MIVRHCDGSATELLNPHSDTWGKATAESISLNPIPLDLQPTRYIKTKWQDHPYGTVRSVLASALAADAVLYVRLEWQDDEVPNGEFADAAAVVAGKGPAETLGAKDNAATLWFWAADREQGSSFWSEGPGVFRQNPASEIAASASLDEGVWRVVLAGPLSEVADERIGFAVWNGSNEERAGLGAVSGGVPLEQEN